MHSVSENPAEYRYCYNSYAAAVTEVEIDVLTGESQVLRVDILYDCGTRYIIQL
jgi:xanthine dehydrogenase/oxidase